MRREPVGGNVTVVFRLHLAPGNGRVAARGDPALAHRRQARGQIGLEAGFRVRARRVIDPDRGFLRVAQPDFAERRQDIGASLRRGIDLGRALHRTGRNRLGGGCVQPGVGVHCAFLRSPSELRAKDVGGSRASSLRRHDPDQVQRVRPLFAVSAHTGAPRALIFCYRARSLSIAGNLSVKRFSRERCRSCDICVTAVGQMRRGHGKSDFLCFLRDGPRVSTKRDRIRPVAEGLPHGWANPTSGSSEAGMGTVLNKPRTSAA